eukprot:GHVH01009540.1.p1 GENE.GHVH01009540.1~~GHVH01009540.1.p1  ORF type:complete len:339 (-),score=48.52 GHVH01009540.1:1327-2343(-)
MYIITSIITLSTTLAHSKHVNQHDVFAPVAIGKPSKSFCPKFDGPLPEEEGYPIVVSHGMGDACEDPALIDLVQDLSKRKGGRYVTCIADSKKDESSHKIFNFLRDVWNGLFGNLNDSVDYYADRIRADPHLSEGFHAVGFSQGNLIVRGYVERVNNPPVKRFISIHGPLVGIGGLPHCNPELSGVCQTFFKYASIAAYTSTAQSMIFQADYVRSPMNIEKYLHSSYLPDINNEIDDDNPLKRGSSEVYTNNFTSLEKLILVKADKDDMVFPSISSWFGFYRDGSYDIVDGFRDTKWYNNDLFGLKTLDERGDVILEESGGGHCQLTHEEYIHLISYL